MGVDISPLDIYPNGPLTLRLSVYLHNFHANMANGCKAQVLVKSREMWGSMQEPQMGHTSAYFPFGALSLVSQIETHYERLIFDFSGVDLAYRNKKSRRIVLKRTSFGILFRMG